jgi:hypothetical protein
MTDSLDDLFDEAQRAAGPRVKRLSPNQALRKHLAATAQAVHELYTNPENWERTTGLVIIHEETQSVIGNFSKYVHRTVKGCWRAVRESAPIAVSETLRVSGDWWIGADRRPEPPHPWHETRSLRITLHLPELNAFAPLVEVHVKLEHGAIARVELAADTLFSDPDGHQLLRLPAGVNVLPVMTLDAKIDLREELRI